MLLLWVVLGNIIENFNLFSKWVVSCCPICLTNWPNAFCIHHQTNDLEEIIPVHIFHAVSIQARRCIQQAVIIDINPFISSCIFLWKLRLCFPHLFAGFLFFLVMCWYYLLICVIFCVHLCFVFCLWFLWFWVRRTRFPFCNIFPWNVIVLFSSFHLMSVSLLTIYNRITSVFQVNRDEVKCIKKYFFGKFRSNSPISHRSLCPICLGIIFWLYVSVIEFT